MYLQMLLFQNKMHFQIIFILCDDIVLQYKLFLKCLSPLKKAQKFSIGSCRDYKEKYLYQTSTSLVFSFLRYQPRNRAIQSTFWNHAKTRRFGLRFQGTRLEPAGYNLIGQSNYARIWRARTLTVPRNSAMF